MGIRWEDYRNRRALKVNKWSQFLGIKTYEDMRRYLLGIGVIPPVSHHQDVLSILSINEAKIKEESPQEKKSVKAKQAKPSKTPRKRRSTKARFLKK